MMRLEQKKDGFSLVYRGRTILTHSLSRPAIVLGKGNGSYNMSHGSFKIKDKLVSKTKTSIFNVVKEESEYIALDFTDLGKLECRVNDDRLVLQFIPAAEYNRFWISLCADASEHIYGCGEQYSELDMRGKKVPLWVEEQGVGRGHDLITLLADIHSKSGGSWYTTYFAQPTFVSSANYFCHVETTSYAEFDFRSSDKHVLHVWDVPQAIVINVAQSAPEVLADLSLYLGRQPALPEWTFDGVWLGVQGGTAVVDSKLQQAKEAGVKIGALWAQDWEGIRITSFGKQLMWDWKYDSDLYDGLPDYIKKLNRENIKFMGYINPFLAVSKDNEGQVPVPDNFLYHEAKRRNLCVKNTAGEDYLVKITTFPAAVIDLTNPETFEWVKDVIKKNMIELGLQGWMADFAEYMPVDAIMHSGVSGEKEHNRYPVLWAKANREAVEESGKLGDCVFFMRAGYTGTSRYSTAMWAGDQLVNWSMDDGLATVIPAGISLGFCAIGQYHSDIGGYTSVAYVKRSKECFMRWAEASAFMPIMRTHECNRPDINWQFNSDEETLQHFAKMTSVYSILKPYHIHTGREYTEQGLPPMRHPYIHYENDEKLHQFKYQYLYGRDLLVAPVYKKGKKSMKVYLPDDTWVHFWSGATYTGGWCTVDAPLGQPPVFYRKNSSFAELFQKAAQA